MSYVIIQSYNHLQFIQSNKSHSFIQLYIHTLILSRINAYTTYTLYQFTHDCISHPESRFGRVSSVLSLLIIVSSRKFLKINILHLPSSYQKCHPQCVWSRDVTHYKPSGFWRTLVKCFTKAEWILANLLSKAEWILAKAEWILANLLSKAEWILANLVLSPVDSGETFYQKPSGFSQMFYQAEWILANVLPSRVDSRKCFTKPGGFSQMFTKPSGFSHMFYQAEWILANVLPSRVDSRKSCTKPNGFGRNLLRNRVDFRQTFISKIDSLQVFSLIKRSHVGISFRMLVVTPLR